MGVELREPIMHSVFLKHFIKNIQLLSQNKKNSKQKVGHPLKIISSDQNHLVTRDAGAEGVQTIKNLFLKIQKRMISHHFSPLTE
jgi:hypothetical protein